VRRRFHFDFEERAAASKSAAFAASNVSAVPLTIRSATMPSAFFALRQTSHTGNPDSVATLERRISALRWNFAQRGEKFDRADRHVATVLAGVRRTQGRPPEQKEAILPEDLKAMIATLDLGDLRGLRDRAILLIGFAGGLRRSEIVGLDCGARQTQDGTGWTEILNEGILVTLRGKTGWREVEIGRGSSDLSCPVVALEAWLKFARIEHGPLFRRVIGKSPERLADKRVARLVKQTAKAAAVRGDPTEGERERKFSGHSLRALDRAKFSVGGVLRTLRSI
jgi:integrase